MPHDTWLRWTPIASVALLACTSEAAPHLDAETSGSSEGSGEAASTESTAGETTDTTSGAADDTSSGDTSGGHSSVLEAALHARLDGDRTGACVAAAVIDGADVEQAVVCASEPRDLDGAAFEIGSVSKTMTAFLVARAIERDLMTLDDPITTHLPPQTAVPTYGDEAILVSHLLTHTSGLPSVPAAWIADMDPVDPFAHVDDARLLETLGDSELAQAPGVIWDYSNFGYMTLSLALTRAFDAELETVLHDELFAPLGIGAFIDPPRSAKIAQPHLSNGTPTPSLTFAPALAGVGGVRASLDDLTRYAQAVLGDAPPELAPTFALANATLREEPPGMAMGWFELDTGGGKLLMHDGGTGGSSTIVVLDLVAARGVVVLSDTTWIETGGLEALAGHLFDPASGALESPRLEEDPPADLVAALDGDYIVPALGLHISLQAEDGVLFAEIEGTSTTPLGFDSYGDFFTRGEIDGVLRPMLDEQGQQTFALLTAQGPLPAVRQ